VRGQSLTSVRCAAARHRILSGIQVHRALDRDTSSHDVDHVKRVETPGLQDVTYVKGVETT